jgi:hypothetical protein
MPLKLDQLLSDDDRAAFLALIARPGTTGKAATAWLRERGYDACLPTVYNYIQHYTPERKRKRTPLKLERLVRGRDKTILDEMVADPGKTIDDIHRWLRGRGYDASRVAVANYRNRWHEELTDVQRCARLATALAEVAQSVSPDAHSQGSLVGVDQIVLQEIHKLRKKELTTPKDLSELSDSLDRALDIRKRLDAITRRNAKANEKTKGADHPRRPFDGVELSNAVRRIFGVPLPGEPTPGLPASALPPPTEPPALPAPATPSPPAPEGRQTLAHDASRGEQDCNKPSPGGA